MARRRATSGRGFTLIEAALATIIIGVGVVALVEAHQAFMRTNQWSSHAAAATYLGNELREFMRDLPRHDPASGLWIDSGSGSPVLTGWGPEPGEVTILDFDDLDDFDGISFAFDGSDGLADGDLPGPVDAFGIVIPEIFADGSIMLDPGGDEVPMIGWVQTVIVEKVDPANLSTPVADDAIEPPSGVNPGRAVDEYPVRVQVIVSYAGPFQAYAEEITRVSWIVP
ncbi:MAG: hypothetical protein ACF8R7_18405 [Phycisphaerales bacterium JB039]